MSSRVVQHHFGGPEVLEIVEVSPPVPGPGELLVRAHAASLNPVDGKTRRGQGVAGVLGAPPFSIGWDVAGVVEAVGEGVSGYTVGDRVFGMPRFPKEAATYATFVVVPADEVAISPASVDDLHAAAVPLAGLTALQAFRQVAEVKPGQRVLVLAAGGGVGHLAVQIAKILGAEVVATASPEKRDFVRSLGAAEIIDYRSTSIEEALAGRPVDVVLDLLGGDNGVKSVEVTRPGGIVVAIPSGVSNGLTAAAQRAGVRVEGMLVYPDGVALAEIASWIDEGKLAPTVGSIYPLAEVALAHAELDAGHALGKIVLSIP